MEDKFMSSRVLLTFGGQKKRIPRGHNDFVENEEIRIHFEITSYHR